MVYKPLSLEWLKTYVLLRLNEVEPKHDPIIDASNHLLLFNKIPVNERNKCKIKYNTYEKIMKCFNKQCLKNEIFLQFCEFLKNFFSFVH